jgi:stress-induced morphogen
MPISQAALEEAIRAAIPCDHLEVIDDSNGCGENYAVLVVSSAFEGKTTLNRHRFSACLSLSYNSDSNASLSSQ